MDTLHPKLGRWLMREQEAAQALARLGMEAAAERARQDAACLRGIFLLMEEHVPKPLPPSKKFCKASFFFRSYVLYYCQTVIMEAVLCPEPAIKRKESWNM